MADGTSFDAEKQFIANIEDAIARPVDIPNSIKRYQDVLQYASSKVDYVIGYGLYMAPSDVKLKMTLEAWKKVFALLLALAGALLVITRIYQVEMIPFHGYLRTSITAGDSERAVWGWRKKYAKNDPQSLFVYPWPSSLAFKSSQVFPYFYRLPQSHHPSDRHRVHRKLSHSLPDLSMNGIESKLILFYNPPDWFRKKILPFLKLRLKSCPIKSCMFSIDRTDLQKADAVIVDGVELKMIRPMMKQPTQVWIFFALESPVHIWSPYTNHHWRQMFNWTFTYRLDSDIAKPYNILLLRPVSKNYISIAKEKTKSAVWLVSHCETNGKRELYVKELKKYYNVDIFGACGNRTKLDVATILNPYRFYLAFENSLCFDYITEKLFTTYAADINIIPVVRGGANYDTMIPKGTFINTAHFNSPEELGKYLTYLENNVTAYADYLQQNGQFVSEGSEILYQKSFCEICVKLHNLGLYKNWYTDIGQWYKEGICTNPTDVTLSHNFVLNG